jgi:beta-glucosidase
METKNLIILFIGVSTLMTVVLFCKPWLRYSSPAERALKLLSDMDLSEKVALLHGINGDYVGNVAGNSRLGIPAIKMNDGPQGFRDESHPGTSTAWPSAMTVGATWDEELMMEWGKAMGAEFYGKGANILLGPGVNIARVPQNGRNFEYISGEDPYLGYTMVQPLVKGIQSQKVMANAKHFVLNNQETNRDTVSDDADERTRFELYYQPFLGAIEAGVGSFMCSYNKVYKVWSCENNGTLGVDLRDRLKFQGFVMSDWGATHSTSIQQGLDMEMPGDGYFGNTLLQLIQQGKIPQSVVDTSVMRILTAMYQVGIFEQNNTNLISNNVSSAVNNDLARKLSAASTVLLQNKDNILPLDPSNSSKTYAVIGWADKDTFTHGEGSGRVVPPRVITNLMGVQNKVKGKVLFDRGYDINSAASLASKADVAIIFVGTSSSEGIDRSSLNVDGNGDDLIRAVAAKQPNTIVVVSTPGAILTPWRNQVKAVLTNFMPGQEVGFAIADVLFGDVNPSARLTITLPQGTNDEGFTPEEYPGTGNPPAAEYYEGLFVGYRWYDQHNIDPAYAFGHGLSYTQFLYSSVKISRSNRNENIARISCTLRNAGERAGAEVAQLYIGYPQLVNEPPKQLRGFKKVFLEPGQSQTIDFDLSGRDLSIWDSNAHDWALVKGDFQIFIGASSRDIRLTSQLTV